MSSMEIFHILKNIFLALGIILFVAAVVEFFAFNIKKIFQDLSGITRKREIRQMTEDTEYTGQLKRRSAGARHEKMMTPSGRLSSASAPARSRSRSADSISSGSFVSSSRGFFIL